MCGVGAVPPLLESSPAARLCDMDAVEPNGVPRAVPSTEPLPVEFDGRLVGHLAVDSAGERDEWEMHPHQDEQVLHVRGGEACIVPKGKWHRQVVISPAECCSSPPKPSTVHTRRAPEGETPKAADASDGHPRSGASRCRNT